MSIFEPITSVYYDRKNLIVSTISTGNEIYITDIEGNLKHKFGGYGQADGKFNFSSKSYTYPGMVIKEGKSIDVIDEILIKANGITHCQKIFTLYIEHGNLDFSKPITITDGVETFTYDSSDGTLKSDNPYNEYIQFIEDLTHRLIVVFYEVPKNDIKISYSYFDDLLICSDVFNHRIQILQLDNTFVTDLKADQLISAPCGLALNSDESELFICSRGQNKIVIVDMNNYTIKTYFGDFGHGDGDLYNPHDIYLVNDNTAIVTDTDNNRLVKFVKDSITDIWDADEPYVVFNFSNNTYKTHTIGPVGIVSNDKNSYVISDYHIGVLTLYNDLSGNDGSVLYDRGFDDNNVYFPRGIRSKNGNNIIVVSNSGRYRKAMFTNDKNVTKMKFIYDINNADVDYILNGGNISDIDLNNIIIMGGTSINDDISTIDIIGGFNILDI